MSIYDPRDTMQKLVVALIGCLCLYLLLTLVWTIFVIVTIFGERPLKTQHTLLAARNNAVPRLRADVTPYCMHDSFDPGTCYVFLRRVF